MTIRAIPLRSGGTGRRWPLWRACIAVLAVLALGCGAARAEEGAVRLFDGGAAEVTLDGGLGVTLPPGLTARLDALLLHDDDAAVTAAVERLLRRHGEGDPVMLAAIARYAAHRAPDRQALIARARQGMGLADGGLRVPVRAVEGVAEAADSRGRSSDAAGLDAPRTAVAGRERKRAGRGRNTAPRGLGRADLGTGRQGGPPPSLTPSRPPALGTGPLLSSALTTTVVGPSPTASPSALSAF